MFKQSKSRKYWGMVLVCCSLFFFASNASAQGGGGEGNVGDPGPLPTWGEVSRVTMSNVYTTTSSSHAVKFTGGSRRLTIQGENVSIHYFQGGKSRVQYRPSLSIEVQAQNQSESYATPLSSHVLRAGDLSFFTSYLNVCAQLATHVAHVNRNWKYRELTIDFFRDYRISRVVRGGEHRLVFNKKNHLRGAMRNEGDALACQARITRRRPN